MSGDAEMCYYEIQSQAGKSYDWVNFRFKPFYILGWSVQGVPSWKYLVSCPEILEPLVGLFQVLYYTMTWYSE